MSSKRKPTKTRRTVSAKKLVKFCGIMLVCIYAICILAKQQNAISEGEQELNRLAEENASYTLKEEALKEELEQASTDDEYAQQKIREELGFIKPNERVFIDISQAQ